MADYPSTPTDPTVYAQAFGPAEIVNLSATAEGSTFRSSARAIARGDLAHVMPIMGVRLFYGLRHDGVVVEYVLTSRAFATAERAARAECDLLWAPGAFVAKTWEVYGRVLEVGAKRDLSPVETTRHALAWGRALGY